MKRAAIWLAAAFLLVPLSAMADQCITGGNGSAACGYNCVNDGFGRAVCATTSDGACIVDGFGNGVCTRFPQLNGDQYSGTQASCIAGGNGRGACGYNCVNDGFGVASCSASPDQSCIVDAYGHGVCG